MSWRKTDGRVRWAPFDAVDQLEAAAAGLLSFRDFQRLFDDMPVIIGGCPTCGIRCMHVDCTAVLVMHLNDVHRWTREAIADWIESIEPRAVPASVEARDPTAAEVS